MTILIYEWQLLFLFYFVAIEKFLNLFVISVYVMSFSSLTAYKIFFLSLLFLLFSYDMPKCIFLNLFSWASWIKDLCPISFGKFSAIISANTGIIIHPPSTLLVFLFCGAPVGSLCYFDLSSLCLYISSSYSIFLSLCT